MTNEFILFSPEHYSDLHWSQPGEKKLTGGTNWQPKTAPSTTWNPATMVGLSAYCASAFTPQTLKQERFQAVFTLLNGRGQLCAPQMWSSCGDVSFQRSTRPHEGHVSHVYSRVRFVNISLVSLFSPFFFFTVT